MSARATFLAQSICAVIGAPRPIATSLTSLIDGQEISDQQKTDLVNWTCSRPVASHPRLEALSLEITNLNAEEARIDPLTEDDFFQVIRGFPASVNPEGQSRPPSQRFTELFAATMGYPQEVRHAIHRVATDQTLNQSDYQALQAARGMPVHGDPPPATWMRILGPESEAIDRASEASGHPIRFQQFNERIRNAGIRFDVESRNSQAATRR